MFYDKIEAGAGGGKFNLGGNSGVQQNILEHPQQYADGMLHLNLEQDNKVEPMEEYDRD